MTYKDKGWGTDYIDNQRRAELLLQRTAVRLSAERQDRATPPTSSATSTRARPTSSTTAPPTTSSAASSGTPRRSTTPASGRRLSTTNSSASAHAIEIYRDITNHETDPKRIEEATKRLAELSGTSR